MSVKCTKPAPMKIPIMTGSSESNLFEYNCSALSNAGKISDQNEAAVITPAAKPRLASKNERLYPLKTKTVAEPAAVNAHVRNVANKVCATDE